MENTKRKWAVCPNCGAPHPAEESPYIAQGAKDHPYYPVFVQAMMDLYEISGKDLIKIILERTGYDNLRQVPRLLWPHLTALFIAYTRELEQGHRKTDERQ